jgi:hypothetical protein
MTGAMTSDQAILEDRERARSLKRKVLAGAARLENAGALDGGRQTDRPETFRTPE